MKTMVFFRRLSLQELVLHVTADQRVERAEGLVHEQQVGVGGQRAGETHALLHTAGQLVGPGLLPAFETGHPQRLGGTRLAGLTRHALDLQAVRGVLQDAPVGEEREVLEHHADLGGADVPQIAGAQGGQVLAVEQHAARGGVEQTVEHPQQGGLARAGQPHDDEDLSRLHGERGVDHRCGRSLGAQLVAVGAALELPHGFIGSSSEDFVQVFGLQPGHIHLTR